jgi:hypothetical protein
MSIYIYDPNALDLMERVEGERWRKDQDNHRESPYGFWAWANAWKQVLADGGTGEDLREYVDNGDGMIYGEGGYSRYVVNTTGEIVLLGWSTRPARQEAAKNSGFSISGS